MSWYWLVNACKYGRNATASIHFSSSQELVGRGCQFGHPQTQPNLSFEFQLVFIFLCYLLWVQEILQKKIKTTSWYFRSPSCSCGPEIWMTIQASGSFLKASSEVLKSVLLQDGSWWIVLSSINNSIICVYICTHISYTRLPANRCQGSKMIYYVLFFFICEKSQIDCVPIELFVLLYKELKIFFSSNFGLECLLRKGQ